MTKRLIRGHWYRAHTPGGPCVFRQDGPCGQSREAHVQAVGEWMDAAHWFRPRLRRPWRCARCGHVLSHGVHHFAGLARMQARRAARANSPTSPPAASPEEGTHA